MRRRPIEQEVVSGLRVLLGRFDFELGVVKKNHSANNSQTRPDAFPGFELLLTLESCALSVPPSFRPGDYGLLAVKTADVPHHLHQLLILALHNRSGIGYRMIIKISDALSEKPFA